MQAIVLVGGFGTRLRPLTLSTPKQMLPLLGRPMIEHVVAALAEHGVTKVILSLGYRDDAFRNAFPEGTIAGIETVYVTEPDPMGTAGAIRYAWEAAGDSDEPFIAVNGDVLTGVDFAALVTHHKQTGAQATIHLISVDDPSRYGVVTPDSDDRVLSFAEKPSSTESSHLINAGAYVLEPSVMETIPSNRSVSIERETFPALVDAGTLWSYTADTYWVDAGTSATYLQAHQDLLDGTRPMPKWLQNTPDFPTSDLVHPDAAIAADATLQNAALMESTSIRDSAQIDRSMIMRGAMIGIGARITDSVIMDSARIGAYATINNSVVGVGAVVGAGVVLSEGTLIGTDAEVDAGEQLVAARIPTNT